MWPDLCRTAGRFPLRVGAGVQCSYTPEGDEAMTKKDREPAATPTAKKIKPTKRTYRGSTIRSVRVADELWEPASVKAAANGTTASAIMVAALRAYVKRK